MLWVYLWAFFRYCLRFILPPPKVKASRFEPDKLTCPACGNKGASFRFERATVNSNPNQPMIRCTCSLCFFSWFEHPVSTPRYPAK